MTTRLLLAILVVLSLAASGCSCNRGFCRRMFNHSDGCYCSNQPACNCGCNSCNMNSCNVNGSYMGGSYMGGSYMGGYPSCQGGMCSSCSGGSPMMSGYADGEVMQDVGYMPSDGGAMGPVGAPGCNCGGQ